MTSPVKIWRNQKKTTDLLGKIGEIISWTLVRVPPAGFESQAPYPVAIVELKMGGRIIAQLVDYEEKDLKYGRKVTTVIRKTSQPEDNEIIPYGIKVKPIWAGKSKGR
jgi:uncharacterized OB-fold protein